MQLSKKKPFLSTPRVKEPLWAPIAKRVRVRLGGKTIADSRLVMLLRDMPPVYYFSKADVRMEWLESSDRRKDVKWGKAVFYHVSIGDSHAENAAWSIEKADTNTPADLTDRIAFIWDAMDEWLEEDELVRFHPRDPYTRLDPLPSTQHVRVEIDGDIVAETTRPMLLFETGLPVRYYIPRTDVRMDLLEPSDLKTRCPYKGVADYFSIKGGGSELENVIWTYPYPNREVDRIKDMLCFYHEKLDGFSLDGHPIK